MRIQDGTKRQLSDEDFGLVHGELKTIRFVPVVVGAGGNGVLQTVVGVVLLVASIWYPALLPTAFGMLAGGISQLLAPKPKKMASPNEERPITSMALNRPKFRADQFSSFTADV